MKQAEGNVTLKMIAQQAGVSIGTVDRALNNRSGVNEGSKKHVLKVAEELGYRPNKIASALGRKRRLHIGIVYPEEPRDFYRDIDMGIDRAIDELHDYGVTVDKLRCHTQNPDIALETLRKIDPKQYDGLAINSAGPSSVDQIDRFMQAGTPVITFNTDSPESNRLFFVGNNSRQSGLIGGEMLAMLLGGRGNVTVLGNFARAAPFTERLGGFCEYFQENYPNMNIYPCQECQTDPNRAAEGLIDLLERSPDINGVFCTGHSSTVGAVNALKQLNRNDIALIGYDVTGISAQALKDGWCRALLYQEPYRQGHQAAHLLVRHILEGWLPQKPRLHVETQIVIKSNLESYIEKMPELFQNNLERWWII